MEIEKKEDDQVIEEQTEDSSSESSTEENKEQDFFKLIGEAIERLTLRLDSLDEKMNVLAKKDIKGDSQESDDQVSEDFLDGALGY